MALTLNNMLPAESSMTYDGGNFLLVVLYFETPGPGHFKVVNDCAPFLREIAAADARAFG